MNKNNKDCYFIPSIQSLKDIKQNNKNNSNKNYGLITFDEFKDYLLKNISSSNQNKSNIQLIETNNALNIMKKRYTHYKSTKSNIQISSIYKPNVNIIYKNRLDELFSHFIEFNLITQIHKMIEDGKKDDFIIDFIKKNLKLDKTEDKNYKLAQISNVISNFTSTKKPKILDVGAGFGKKIKTIKCLVDSDIYGADIKTWGSYNNKRKFSFPFEYIQLNPYKIPYDDKMFDCITIMFTLHHAKNLIETINECKRILKDDGIIVLEEHDIWDDYDNMIIELQHRIYDTVFDEKTDYSGIYYNKYEWDIIFNKCNMKPVYNTRVFEDATSKIRYDLPFIAVYKKK